jgi:hypothetical protein
VDWINLEQDRQWRLAPINEVNEPWGSITGEEFYDRLSDYFHQLSYQFIANQRDDLL